MEDVFDAAWQERSAARITTVEAELASLIDIFGLPLLEEPGEIRRLLTRACPDAQDQIRLVLGALSAEVPQRLRGAKVDETLPGLLQDCTQHLLGHGSIDAGWASWAVRTWAQALGLPTAGLDDVARGPLPESSAPGVVRVGTAPPSIAGPHAARRTDARRGSGDDATNGSSWGDGIRHAMRIGRPRDGAPPRPEAVTRGAPSDPEVKPDGVQPARSLLDEPTEMAGVPMFAHDAIDSDNTRPRMPAVDHEHPPILVEPLFSEHDLERIARDAPRPLTAPTLGTMADPSPGTASAFDAGVTASPTTPTAPMHAAVDARTWGRPHDGPGRRIGWPLVAAALAIVVALGIFFGEDATRWIAGQTASKQPASIDTASTTARSSTPGPTAPASTTPDTPSTATAPIADAAPARPTRNGSDDPPVVATTEPRPSPQTAPPDATHDASSAAGPDTRAPASPDADRRPQIARIDVPRAVEGQPFTLALRLAGNARDVASVERRTVESRGWWPKGGAAPQRVEVRRSGSGALLVPYRAMDAPASATLEFTVIGRDGSRSDAKSATIAVAGPTLAAADSGDTGPCTSATCGTVVESRELEHDIGAGSSIYQVVVRMDDRQTRASTALYRLQVGSRVRMVRGHFVPAGSNLP